MIPLPPIYTSDLINNNLQYEYYQPIRATDFLNTNSEKVIEIYNISMPITFNKCFSLENKIKEFSKLGFNWDGYNGVKPSEKVIDNSIDFLQNLPHNYLNFIQKDSITPTSYGTIVFDFENINGMLSIELGENTIGYFSDFKSAKNISLEGKEINNESFIDVIIPAFQRLSKTSFL